MFNQASSSDFLQQVSNLFTSNNRASPKRQRGARTDGQEVANPFDEQQSDWLQASLQETMKTFGKAVDSRFNMHQVEILAQRARIEKLEAALRAVQLAPGDVAMSWE